LLKFYFPKRDINSCTDDYLFGAIPDKMTWFGILIIVGAGIYIALREIKLEQNN
jgi:drug/metabolite transporter (DMT)-like permease